MSRRDTLFAVGGGAIGAVLTYGSTQLSNAHLDAVPRRVVEGRKSEDSGDASVDPAMVANANLAWSLHQC